MLRVAFALWYYLPADMTSPLRVAVVVALALADSASALAAETAPANSATYPTSADENVVDYDAPSNCPGVNAYFAQVEQRVGPNWRAALQQLAQHLNVTITRVADRYLGTLEFVNDRGERFSRTVSGTVCSEVVDGTGLMTALAVQARVSGTIDPSRSGETTGEPPGNASTREQATSSPAPILEPAITPPRPGARSNVHIRVGARASLTSGVGPAVAMGPGAFVALELGRARLGLGGDGLYAPDVQASLGRADFRLLSARLEGCPWSFQLRAWATLEPCAAGELGSFWVAPHVNPPAVTVSEPKAITWGALGLLGRAVFRIQPVVATIELLGRVPLRRERFYVASRDQVIYRIPALSAGASVGLGLQF